MRAAPDPTAAVADAQSEVVELCRQLIRIDTSNYGDDPGPGEREAAEFVQGRLEDVGFDCTYVETGDRRGNVVARLEGADRDRGALLVHGHLDVVPANAADWQVDPFAGEVKDGCVWGRGAVDMKDMVAMTLATARSWKKHGIVPPRDIVFAFVADEEAGGYHGAKKLVQTHGHLFDDCTEAISEVGGYSHQIDANLRLYLIETAQKGLAWMKLTARGRAGHGSMIADDNAVVTLAEAVARLGRHDFEVRPTKTVLAFLNELSDALGVELDTDDLKATVAKLGPLARFIGATLHNTANPTMLQAGYKHNVVPGEAVAYVDGRFLPGHRQDFEDELDAVIGPDVQREYLRDEIALETTFDGDLVEAMGRALVAEDPGARAVPYCMSGGTDAKHFSTLGIRCFGFSPLRLPPELDFSGMFHGIDERVPTEGLEFGVRVLDRFFSDS